MQVTNQKPVELSPLYTASIKNTFDPVELVKNTVVKPLFQPLIPGVRQPDLQFEKICGPRLSHPGQPVRTAGSGGNGRGQSNPALCRRGKHPHRLENLSIHPATARRRVPNQHGWEPVPSPPCSSPAPRGLSLLVWVAGRLPFPYYLSPLGAGSGSFFIWWAFPP